MKKPLTIAVDARPLAFPYNGIGRYTVSLMGAFASMGLPYRIFLYSDRPFQPDFALPQGWKIRTGQTESGGRSTAFAQTVFPVWAFKDRIDVFWSPRHQLPLLLSPRIRKVVTIHDIVWKRFPQTMRRAGPAVEALLTPQSLRIADQVIAVSQFTRSELAAVFPSIEPKIRVIYRTSSLRSGSLNQPNFQPSPYFLFVGSSEPRKNLRGLLLAYKQYRASSTDPFDLVIAGSDQWGTFSVSDFARTNGLLPSVHVIKDPDDASLCNLYAHAQAVVMVSLYEGFGLPLVEAMQWGIPLVASNTSAVAEIAGDAAILVDPMNIDAIALALNRISESPEARSMLARQARSRGSQFKREKEAAETISSIVGNFPQCEIHD